MSKRRRLRAKQDRESGRVWFGSHDDPSPRVHNPALNAIACLGGAVVLAAAFLALAFNAAFGR